MNKTPKREGDFIGQGDWGAALGEDAMWELESQMRAAHPSLFESGKILGTKFLKGWESCNTLKYY